MSPTAGFFILWNISLNTEHVKCDFCIHGSIHHWVEEWMGRWAKTQLIDIAETTEASTLGQLTAAMAAAHWQMIDVLRWYALMWWMPLWITWAIHTCANVNVTLSVFLPQGSTNTRRQLQTLLGAGRQLCRVHFPTTGRHFDELHREKSQVAPRAWLIRGQLCISLLVMKPQIWGV